MKTDPFADLTADEQGFRRALLATARDGAWDDFHATRLVLADWLADRGREREASLTRAGWRKASGGEKLQTWLMELPHPIVWRYAPVRLALLEDTTNSCWLLHFAPETLKFQVGAGLEDRPAWATFTWQAQRSTVLRYDLGAHLEGFAYLLRYSRETRP